MNEDAALILAFLANAAKAITYQQLEWFTNCIGERAEVHKLIAELFAEGLIREVLITDYEPCRLHEPLVVCDPESSRKPDFAAAIKAAEERRSSRLLTMKGITLAEEGARVYGGVMPDLSNQFTLSHDLGVTEILLHQRIYARQWKIETENFQPVGRYHLSDSHFEFLTTAWKGADWCRGNGISVGGLYPDLVTVSGKRVEAAFDYCGKYEVTRLKNLWKACRALRIPLEIW